MDFTKDYKHITETDFLSNGGEMEGFIRSFDWSRTPLGTHDTWPQNLKSAVNIILQSSVPMVIVWGKEGILIYNDAYSIFAGKRHPQLLGSKVLEGWPEVADFNRTMLAKVLNGERLSYENQRLTLHRNHIPEDVWMNLNYSPIMDERGKPAGALAIVVETTQSMLASQKQKYAEDNLKLERQRLFDLFINAPAAIAIFAGPDLIFQLANEPYRKLIGKDYPLEGKGLLEVLPEVEPSLLKIVRNVAFKGERFTADELPVKLDWDNMGSPYTKFLNFIYEPYYENGKPNGLMAFAYDVTGQVQSRRLIEDQNKVLEMITGGDTLSEALNFLIRSIETLSDHRIIGSILLLNKDGQTLSHCAAPSLPKEYNNAINGIRIGPAVGSCGTAAFTKAQVIVSDIATDPLWKDFKALALGHDLHSCWSSPILSGEQVLGTFALYSREVREPSDEDKKIIEFALRTAKLIIERKEIENTLKEREEHLRALVTSTSDVIYVMSPDWSEMGILDGRVFVPNPGKPLGNWEWFKANVPAEEHERVKKVIQEAIADKKIFQLEHGVVRADNSIGWTSSRAVPILDKNGNIEKWFGAATDITEQKRIEVALKESEALFRSLSDQSPMIVFIIEPNDQATISYWSKSWLDYTGQTLEEALGRAWDGIVHPDDVPTVLDIYTSAFNKRVPYTIPAIRLKRHDGEYRWHHFKASPRLLEDGTFMGYVGVGIDIDNQQVALQELESKNKQLIRINNDLDSFIYTASHDLKAPVSNIEGLLTSLKEVIKCNNSQLEEQHQIMTLIDKSILRFKNTIADLTDIAKVQKNIDADLEELNIQESIHEVLETIADLIKESHAIIKINIDDTKTIRFSRMNLKSIFYNLISNAIKYRSPERPAVVEISCTTDKEYFILVVKDNGLGIKDENKSKLFTMFKRFHDHVEGTGIGLYIVKKIIDNANGKIEVESTLGAGTQFTIYFPFN